MVGRINRVLTPRQVEVLDLLASGLGPTKIARELRVNHRGVKLALRTALLKLNVDSTLALAIYWGCPLFQEGLRALGHLPEGRDAS